MPRPSTGSWRAARSRNRCSAWSTISSLTAADGRWSESVDEIARIERRHRVERRREGQRLTLLDRHVPHVGRVDRLHPSLAQRLVHRARDEILHDLVQDLLLDTAA